MYSQPEAILEQYELTVNQITKGRGSYVCDTNQGIKILTPFRGSKERAAFLREILLYLKEQGFEVEQISLTKNGDVVATDESEIRYVLKDMFAGSECSTRSVEDMKAAMEILGRFHILCGSRCPVEIPEFMNSGRSALLPTYERHLRELVKVKNYIRMKQPKNDFEMRFQRLYPHYVKQAEESIRLLRENGDAKGEYRLCHGDFNQHNVVRTKEGWRMINFEEMNVNLAVLDLANFLRKMLEKNGWSMEIGTQLTEAYNTQRELTKAEYRQLYTLLLFPEKFWKVANHYFNSHKAWISGRDIEKLDKIAEQEEKRIAFLENLFSFIL